MEEDCPEVIDGAKVVCYSAIDTRHCHTGKTRHTVRGVLLGSAAGLAICRYEKDEDSYYLFGCDGDWATLSDTCHESLEKAQEQAEFEYAGVSRTWRFRP